MPETRSTILLALPVTSQPRFIRRIKYYLGRGYAVTVASFERDYFRKNVLPDGIDFYSLGQIESGNYLKRIPKLLKSIVLLYGLVSKSEKVIIFSADILIFISFLFRRDKIEYEIGDIRFIKNNGLFALLYNFFYKKTLVRCRVIYVTSLGFKKYLISNYSIAANRIKVIENKLDSNDFPDSLQDIRNIFPLKKPFVLGVIGLLRYSNILKLLQEYRKNQINNFVINIYGDGPLTPTILKYVDNSTVYYFGQFKYPDDLAGIYEKVDLSFVMYDSEDLNVRLALPNKLYESIYFRRPLVVSSNTFLSEKVDEYKVGFKWDQGEMAELVSYLNSSIFESMFNKIAQNFDEIKLTDYFTS